ncbi:MAG: hemolysin family protein [Sporolactobacillus sp.]
MKRRNYLQDSFGILTIILLILLTAFFVAEEFAIVKIRATRLEELIKQGNKRARATKKIVTHLNAYLSTTQLGISVTALVLGWIGEPTVAHLLHPLFSLADIHGSLATTSATVLSFLLVTIVSVVLGELAPKGIAIQKAETISLAFAYPLIALHRLLFPFIWLLNSLSNLVMRIVGIQPDANHDQALTEGELRLTLADSFKSGEITQGELRYMNRIFDFDDRTAREVMVPRTEMICIEEEEPLSEQLQIIRSEKFTRFPMIKEDKDHVVGMINIKDIFTDILDQKLHSLTPFIRPVLTVLETTPVRELLEKMQKNSIHMAILTDEYGGTSGLVTVEDILEEIVGEIRDEFDEAEEPMIKHIAPDQALVSGKLLISRINQIFQTDIEEEGIDTIGGWMLAEDPTIHEGSVLSYDHVTFKVIRMDAHHIVTIRVTRVSSVEKTKLIRD